MRSTLRLRPCILALATLTVAACSDAPDPVSAGEAAFTKGGKSGGGSTSTDQPVRITWSDQVAGGAAGIASDDAGDYVTDECGVFTMFDIGRRSSGHLTGDFDYSYDGSCGPRHLRLTFTPAGGGAAPAFGMTVEDAPKFIVRGIGEMAVGESGLDWIGFGIQQAGCGRVLFDGGYPGSSSVRITRLTDDTTGARRWSIETQGSHTGVCVVAAKRGFSVESGPYYMPFSFVITEVR